MKTLKVSAIKNGSVIDHLPGDCTFKIIKLLDLSKTDNIISVATNLKSKKQGKKGIIKIGNKTLTNEEVNKIALIAPNASLNIIRDYEVVEKTKLSLPDELIGLLKCFNPMCITNKESMKSKFHVISNKPLKLQCHYCERVMTSKDIKLI